MPQAAFLVHILPVQQENNMALAADMALVQPSVAINPLPAGYRKERAGHGGNHVVIAEPVESGFDGAFFDAMTNVFGDDRPVTLPGRPRA